MSTTNSEIFTLILGGFGVIPLISSISTLNNETTGFDDVAAILMLFIHLLLILVALPFLIRVTRQETITSPFSNSIQLIALLNAILIVGVMFSLPNPNTFAYGFFSVLALIELLPIYLIQSRQQDL